MMTLSHMASRAQGAPKCQEVPTCAQTTPAARSLRSLRGQAGISSRVRLSSGIRPLRSAPVRLQVPLSRRGHTLRTYAAASSNNSSEGSSDPKLVKEVTSDVDQQEWLKFGDFQLLATAAGTGCVVAVAVLTFKECVHLLKEIPDEFGSNLKYFLPAVGGLVVGQLRKQSLSPGLKPLIYAVDGIADDIRVRFVPKVGEMLRKTGAATVTLGTGNSLGPEAPSAEIGASVGLIVSQTLQLDKDLWLPVLASGAAAGVSSAFAAPVTGTFFAIEFVLKGQLDRVKLSAVLLSAAVSSLVAQTLSGEDDTLGRFITVPADPIENAVEIAGLIGLGLATAIAAVTVGQLAKVSKKAVSGLPAELQPAVPGVLVGIIATRVPQIQYGEDHDTLIHILQGTNTEFLPLIFGAKVVATAACVGGGLVGGLFAPSLFLGAMVGDYIGHGLSFVSGSLLPGVDLTAFDNPTVFIVTGMAAEMAALCRAPLTAIALLGELTEEPELILPLLLTCGVSAVMTDQLDAAITKATAPAPSPAPKEEKKAVSVTAGEAAVISVKKRVRASLPLDQVDSFLVQEGVSTALVVDDNETPTGLITRQDIQAAVLTKLVENAKAMAEEFGEGLSYSTVAKSDAETALILEGLEQNFLFRSMSADVKGRLAGCMYERTVQQGEELIRQYQAGCSFYVVESGDFESFMSAGADAPERSVATFGKADSFGEMAIMFDAPKWTVRSRSDNCKVWVLERQAFSAVLNELNEDELSQISS